MSAQTISEADRDVLSSDELERLEELLDFHVGDPEPHPQEWPYEHAPGEARAIEQPFPIKMDEHPGREGFRD